MNLYKKHLARYLTKGAAVAAMREAQALDPTRKLKVNPSPDRRGWFIKEIPKP